MIFTAEKLANGSNSFRHKNHIISSFSSLKND